MKLGDAQKPGQAKHASHQAGSSGLPIRQQVAQTWKLSPQPQRPFSFGLVKVKPADIAFCS
jgi:hypothetical protein